MKLTLFLVGNKLNPGQVESVIWRETRLQLANAGLNFVVFLCILDRTISLCLGSGMNEKLVAQQMSPKTREFGCVGRDSHLICSVASLTTTCLILVQFPSCSLQLVKPEGVWRGRSCT